ncbi:MAG: hypothetical protein ACWGQW_04005 [bacterium]
MAIKVKAKYEKDSRKGNYHRYQIGSYGDMYMGNIYIRTDAPHTPKEFEIELQLKTAAVVRKGSARGG